MVVEGRGLKAPERIIVIPTGEQIDFANRLGRLRAQKYAGSLDPWKRGHRSDAWEVGLLSEIVFAEHMNNLFGRQVLSVDDKIYACGDGGIDFRVCGKSIDVKSAGADGELLLKRRTADNRTMALKAEIYVPAHVDRQNKVTLFGWIKRKTIINDAPLKPARRGDHFNLCAPADWFLPLSRLATWLESRQLISGVSR